MPKAPDGAIMEESSSDDGMITPVGEAQKEARKREDTNPNPAGGAGAHPCREHHACSPGPTDELIAALRKATVGPACSR